MTVPDELVKAVKEAVKDAGYIVDIHAPVPFLNLCIAAVLRALPESEEAASAMQNAYSRHGGLHDALCCERVRLAALARLADDA